MPKSTITKAKFIPGTSRATRTPLTLLRQMAQDAEKLAEQGARIKALREQMRTDEGKKVTQPNVADAVGVSLRGYQNWEAGDGGLRPENVMALAKFFDTTEEYIEYGDRRAEQTPDLVSELGSGDVSQLDRIEAKLERVLTALEEPEASDLDEALDAIDEVVAAAQEKSSSRPTTADDLLSIRRAIQQRKRASS